MSSGQKMNLQGDRRPFVIGLLAFLFAGMIAILSGSAVRSLHAADAPKSTKDGVYSADQAKRGKDAYSQNCSSCHMDDLSGSGQAPPLAGDTFMDDWGGHTLGELNDTIQNTMPLDKPGSLSPSDALDILTYILQANSFPTGKTDLKGDSNTLKGIVISTK